MILQSKLTNELCQKIESLNKKITQYWLMTTSSPPLFFSRTIAAFIRKRRKKKYFTCSLQIKYIYKFNMFIIKNECENVSARVLEQH